MGHYYEDERSVAEWFLDLYVIGVSLHPFCYIIKCRKFYHIWFLAVC